MMTSWIVSRNHFVENSLDFSLTLSIVKTGLIFLKTGKNVVNNYYGCKLENINEGGTYLTLLIEA